MSWPKGSIPWNKGLTKIGKTYPYKSTQIEKTCQICGENFWIYPSVFKKGSGNYCKWACYLKIVGKNNLGSKNGMWKGNKVGYNALHDYIKYHFPKPLLCQICNIKPSLDLANISGKYKRDFSDWEWICRGCHMRKDDRIKNLKNQK